jgi:hypothetical protein
VRLVVAGVVAFPSFGTMAELLDGGRLTWNLAIAVEQGSPVLLRADERLCFNDCVDVWIQLA